MIITHQMKRVAISTTIGITTFSILTLIDKLQPEQIWPR